LNPSSFNGPELSHWALTRRLVALAWRYRSGCFKVLAAQIVLLLANLATIGLTGLGIDALRHAVDPSARPPHWPELLLPPAHWTPMQVLAAIAGGLILTAAARMIGGYYNGVWFGILLQGRVVVDLRAECYDKLQRLNFRFFDANSSSSLINRIGGDVQSVRLFIDGVLFQILTLVISIAAFLAYMLSIHVKLTLACLATTPVLLLTSAAFSRIARPAYKRNSELVDALVQQLAEGIRGMQVIKSFAREPAELARLEAANDAVRDAQHNIFRKVSAFVPFIIFLSQGNIIVLLAYGGWLAVHGQIGVGTGLVGFAAILQQFSGQIANIGNIANSMQQCLRSSQRVFEVLDAPTQIQSPENALPADTLRGEVRFENVTFSHAEEASLKDVIFRAVPGECIAIVGPIGSGKSTLLSLIPRFYDPGQGRILIDGIDVKTLDLSQLRRKIGLVFQESFLFSTTIAANIAFGRPDASQEQIEKAARLAAAHDFITALPDGYHTILGEAGVGLSGGQKQRIAIARALLLEPAILLLDDPTAAVDSSTEHEIAAALDSAMAGRTTFIVAHRPVMLQRASRIIVLENGRITQTGTHQALMDEPGYYRDSLLLQAGEASPQAPPAP